MEVSRSLNEGTTKLRFAKYENSYMYDFKVVGDAWHTFVGPCNADVRK